MTTSDDRYAALRAALAAGPTPGPWGVASDYPRAAVYQLNPPHWRVVCSGNQNNHQRWKFENWSGASPTDAAYIAAADPETIRALLAERDEMREAMRGATVVLAEARRERDALRAERDDLRLQLARVLREKIAENEGREP